MLRKLIYSFDSEYKISKKKRNNDTFLGVWRKFINFASMKQPFVTLRDATARQLDSAAKNMYVSPTKYKWSKMAESICSGKTSAFDKLYAIYRWICLNISYDTEYKIYTADECYDKRKGVCQAYCEMFHHLASAVGIKVVLVVGKTKDLGGVNEYLHAWVMAYTAPDSPILLDPTWGAGSVDGNTFIRNKHFDSWFNVHPSWMILTHFPNYEVYQLLPNKITFEQFQEIPPVRPFLRKFGFTGNEILEAALRHEPLPMPKCYDLDDVAGVRLPHQSALQAGNTYTMHVQTHLPVECLGFVGDAVDYRSEKWSKSGSVAVGTVRAKGRGSFSLGIRQSPDSNSYHIIANYTVN